MRRRRWQHPKSIAAQLLIFTLEEVENYAQLPTPKTPRHRDALSKKVPVTPRHRLGSNYKPVTPHTPRTPKTPGNAPTVFHCARQLFARSADPGRLIGRDRERGELQSFLQDGFSTGSGRSIYLSGPPGTGKSALISEICHDIDDSKGVKTVYINCMSIKSTGEVYSKLADGLLKIDTFQSQDVQNELMSIFVPK